MSIMLQHDQSYQSYHISESVINVGLHAYTVCVKKVAPPPKTFCNIFTQAKYISVKFCQFIASTYPHMLTSFGRVNLIFNKMALIFLGVLIVFYRFKFRVSTSQIALTSSLMMSCPNSFSLNLLDYQVWGKCQSLNKSCNRSQNQFPSFKIHFS